MIYLFIFIYATQACTIFIICRINVQRVSFVGTIFFWAHLDTTPYNAHWALSGATIWSLSYFRYMHRLIWRL